jgi:glycine/D-amino acid oxidase-like deaminating enzyme
MKTMNEPAWSLPVVAEANVCVVGGSCTGLFAAVRAARLGASVVLVERSNCFGGMATNGLVIVWHQFLDTESRQTIIGGLSREIIDRLVQRGAAEIEERPWKGLARVNSEELKIELDELVREHRIQPMLHTFGCQPLMDGERIAALAIENKDGRGVVRSSVFIDATGDGARHPRDSGHRGGALPDRRGGPARHPFP